MTIRGRDVHVGKHGATETLLSMKRGPSRNTVRRHVRPIPQTYPGRRGAVLADDRAATRLPCELARAADSADSHCSQRRRDDDGSDDARGPDFVQRFFSIPTDQCPGGACSDRLAVGIRVEARPVLHLCDGCVL